MFIDSLDHISFAEWLIQLDTCAIQAGYRTEGAFTRVTGQLGWHSYYEEGKSPVGALEAMRMDSAEFAEHYVD